MKCHKLMKQLHSEGHLNQISKNLNSCITKNKITLNIYMLPQIIGHHTN